MWTRYNKDGEQEQVTADELKKGDIVHQRGQRVRYLGDGAFVYLDTPYVLFDSPEEQRRFADQTNVTYVSVGFSRHAENVLTEEGMKDTLRTMHSKGGRHFFHHSVQGASWPTWKDSFKKRYHWYR